jgi:hypothetical protein
MIRFRILLFKTPKSVDLLHGKSGSKAEIWHIFSEDSGRSVHAARPHPPGCDFAAKD